MVGETDPSESRGGEGSVPSVVPGKVTFSRRELDRILGLYGRMVAAGEWRDYAIDFLRDRAVFSVFRRSSEVPIYRIEKNPTSKSQNERMATQALGWRQRNWVTVLLALYVVSALILNRSIFRLVEYKGGFDGYLMTHEVFGYIFDALLMFVAMIVMNVYHPAVILGDGKGEGMRYSEYSETVRL